MKKEDMIEQMKKDKVSIDDFSLGEEMNGWVCMFGTYENYLQNKGEDKVNDMYVDTIYQYDLD